MVRETKKQHEKLLSIQRVNKQANKRFQLIVRTCVCFSNLKGSCEAFIEV